MNTPHQQSDLAEAERWARSISENRLGLQPPGPVLGHLNVLLAEYDRRGQIEQRAIEIATHPEGVATKSLAARSRTRRHVASYILGWSARADHPAGQIR